MTDESMHGDPWADVTPGAHSVKTGSQKRRPARSLVALQPAWRHPGRVQERRRDRRCRPGAGLL